MTDEYYIPPIKGISNRSSRLREFKDGELPVEIALRKDDFHHLGDWKVFPDPDGYGLAYRFGVREGVTDDEGDPANLGIYFYTLFAKKGLTYTPEKVNEQFKKLEYFTYISSFFGHQMSGENFISCAMPAPKWMVDELELDRG